MPVDGPQHGHIVKIQSSGVQFDTQTGKANTDRPVRFEFDQGGGTSMGAEYDPQTRELHMKSQIALDWRGKTTDSVPMHIESGEAFYRETRLENHFAAVVETYARHAASGRRNVCCHAR